MKKFPKQIIIGSALCLVLAAGYAVHSHNKLSDSDYESADTVLNAVYEMADGSSDAQAEAVTRQICEYLQTCAEVDADSVRVNGNEVMWNTQNGITCSYSPYLEEIMSRTPSQSADAGDNTQIISYAKRGTPHGSDIYLFEPYYGLSDDFTDHYQNEAKELAEKSGGTYHYYKGSAANVENIADALEKGGVVIFNSHGTTDYSGENSDNTSGATTSYLCLQTGNGLTTKDYSDGHAVYGGTRDGLSYYQVDGTVLTDHMDKQGSNGLVWMAICLGMSTDGLEQPLMDHGAGAVYGYSQSVTFKGDACFSSYFYDSLESGNDAAQAIADMKDACGEWDYSPKLCAKANLSTFYMARTKEDAQKSRAAFPIFVSAEDPYPGHGKADDTQDVYSTWKLNDHFTVTAQSADEQMGTVSVNGLTVEAVPNEGYQAKSCTVKPENAAVVTKDGNTFRISQLTENCEITVDFEQRKQGTVTFHVPEGMEQAQQNAYLGDSIALPEPTGTLETEEVQYAFAGWSETPIEKPTKTAKFYETGESYLVSEEAQELYAVFTYLGDAQGNACQFTRADAQETDRTGLYIISGENSAARCDGSNAEYAMPFVSNEQNGMLADGDLLNRPLQAYTVKINRVSGTSSYVIRLNGAKQTAYLASSGDSDALTTTANFGKEEARWNIAFEDENMVISSAKYPKRTLRYVDNGAVQYLACTEDDSGQSLIWYKGASDVRTWYTGVCLPTGSLDIILSADKTFENGQPLHASVTAINDSALRRTAVIYLAQYRDNGAMLHTSVLKTVAIPAGKSITQQLQEDSIDSDAKTIKLMVLDSSTQKPLCAACELTRQ